MVTHLLLLILAHPLQSEESALTIWQSKAASAAKEEAWEKALLNLRKITIHRELKDDEEELMACALHKTGHHAEAAVRYHRIVKSRPKLFSATYQLALCLTDMKQFMSAEGYYTQALKCEEHGVSPAYPQYEGKPVEDSWRDTLVKTEHAASLVEWGGILFLNKAKKEGEIRFRQAIGLQEKDPAANPPKNLLATKVFLYAQAFYHQQEYTKARTLFEKFIKGYPEHAKLANAKFKAAICIDRSDGPEHSFLRYEQLIRDHPTSPEAPESLIRMGLFRFNRKEYLAARQLFKRLLKAYPKHESAEKMDFKFGLALILDEEYEKAGQHFEEFARRRPDAELAPASLFWAGDSYMKANMIEEARRNFLRVGKLFSDTKWASFSRGRLSSPVFGGKESDEKK